MHVLYCNEVWQRNAVKGQQLPRHLAGSATAAPLKAAAPVFRYGGSSAPQADAALAICDGRFTPRKRTFPIPLDGLYYCDVRALHLQADLGRNRRIV